MALNITYHRDEPLAPTPLPPSHAESDGEEIIRLFQNLGRSTVWKTVESIDLEGDTFEPEGMIRLGSDRFILSAGQWTKRTEKYGEIIDGTDRTPGEGFSHLMVYNGKGQIIADATISAPGDIEYHNGGLDWDGQFIWGTNAQYRPNTTAYVYKADPYTLEPSTVLRYRDHLGGMVRNAARNTLTALTWGARRAATWDLDAIGSAASSSSSSTSNDVPWPEPRSVIRNPSHFIDYQDCKFLGCSEFYSGRNVALCSGVATIGDEYNLGGIALVDVDTMVPLVEVPISLGSKSGVRLTQNPMDVSVVEGKLRLYFAPDQHQSTVYVIEAQPQPL